MVVSDDFPYMPIRVSIGEWETSGIALIDTGFSGDLLIPEELLPDDLGPPDHLNLYRVADGRFVRAPMYAGSIQIGNLPPLTNVSIGAMGDRFIVGVGIIERYVMTLERGERVIIEE